MPDSTIKYIELHALQQQTKEQLIKKVSELQEQHKKLAEENIDLYKSQLENEKVIEDYETRFEMLFRMHAQTEIIKEDYKRIVDLKLGNTYNINATWIDKIVFVLKAAKRPLRSKEIIEVLLKNDPMFRTLTDPQKGLSAHLTAALKYGRIIGTKEKGQNGYVFSVPESL